MENAADSSSFWRDRSTFVTGATGLLGSWLVRRLRDKGARVTCLVRRQAADLRAADPDLWQDVRLVTGHVADQPSLERVLAEEKVASVFHLAAQAIAGTAVQRPVETFETNIRGTWCMMEACRSRKVEQVIMGSTDKVYGELEGEALIEDMPLQPLYPYDVSKACADHIACCYARTYDVPVAITRCGNLYGGGDLNYSRIVPGTIRSVLQGEAPQLRSSSGSTRDYLYVGDGADAYLLVAEKLSERPDLKGHAFNFAHETAYTAMEMVRKILAITGSELEPVVREQDFGELKRQHLSTDKARDLLGWAPSCTIDQGLARTVDWYRVNASKAGIEPTQT